MSGETKKLEGLLNELKQQRDELRVRMHLAKAEARDEWEKLERKWEALKPELEAAKGEAAKASKNVFAALELVAEEIKAGYKRIRDKLS